MRTRFAVRRAAFGGVDCPRCGRSLPHDKVRTGLQICPGCGRTFEAVRFDPPEARIVVAEVAGQGPTEAPPCARHARNRADGTCARCGQFMCALCAIEADGRSYCPGCFDRLSSEGALRSGATRLWNWQGLGVACILATWLLSFTLVVPLVAWILGIYFCVKGLREKRARQESDGVASLYVTMVLNVLVGAFGVFIALALLGVLGR